ncbi:PREDICTED: 26S protease regulatory subunit 7 [Charadrius vociferus]|uniref:26S protease regulatory subunit 7 n=1 Tax=Charadrius vociferus TaxID=50402 RepID=UPI000521B403|nr:PREDICTED: 26S protease regulatory subunit 7 [Charadrius vociferus]
MMLSVLLAGVTAGVTGAGRLKVDRYPLPLAAKPDLLLSHRPPASAQAEAAREERRNKVKVVQKQAILPLYRLSRCWGLGLGGVPPHHALAPGEAPLLSPPHGGISRHRRPGPLPPSELAHLTADGASSDVGVLRPNEEVQFLDSKFKSTLDEGDIALLKTYGQSTYSRQIKQVEDDIQQLLKKINELTGIKESDTGLAPPALWDLAADKQTLQSEQPLQVARCTKIINADSEDPKYIINVKQFAKFVVDLSDQVAPTDIEEGMRVGVDRNKYQIHIPLPPKIDPTVTMMQVEEKPDVTYSDVGGCKEQIEKLREVVETPLLHPERFVNLGIEPPKGVLLFGPPGTGKTLCARAVANRTDACFIRVIGSELVQKYVGEVRANTWSLSYFVKHMCLLSPGARFDDGAGGDNEVQRTMLELINQLDGFDPRGNIKVLMATNRPDTLDPALMRPGRLDRKIEFSLPDLEGRTHIFKIHARSMSVERDIRFELLARLCPNSTGAEIRSVCTEAGMFAIRARRKIATEKDFLEAVNKVIKSYAKFSATPRYMTYN